MLRTARTSFAFLIAAFGLLVLAGCGSSASTTERSAVVVGKLLSDAAAKAAGDSIEVHLEGEPDVRVAVASDGSFTLRGLPAGSFTLVFTQGGAEVGTLEFSEVAANQQITINVQLVDEEIVLVDEDRRGIGHAGVEIQGLVDNVVVLNPAADSRFVIAGRSVIARPLVTAIREGNTRKTVEDVTAGRQVHVKGTTLEDSTDVLAFEIKLQTKDEDGAGDGGQMTICHIPPGNPSKKKTLTIGASAWPAHEGHGDTEGACED